MKRFLLPSVLFLCLLVACRAQDGPHVHEPDNADCQHAQLCTFCGEKLADQGVHDYPDLPEQSYDGYSIYVCRLCKKVKIVNEHGAPVVPVE